MVVCRYHAITHAWVIHKKMFELKTKCEVTLHTGATIVLTEDQNKRIHNFVVDVVLGSKEKPKEVIGIKRAKRKVKNITSWSEEENRIVEDMVKKYGHLPKNENSRMRAAEIKDTAELLGRTKESVESQYHKIRNQQKKDEVKSASIWNPVLIRK